MSVTVTPFLMFQGRAEEAMAFYCTLLPHSRIEEIERYGPEGPGKPGSVLRAAVTLAGQRFLCIDSPLVHDFTFTPAFSIFVTCATGEEIDRLSGPLGEGGTVLMPVGEYPFARRFTWVADRFGLSWQLCFAGG